MIQNVITSKIKIKDVELIHAEANVVNYLLELDPQKFLYEFNKVSGIENGNTSGYGGWERSNDVNFRGHFFGHYILALSQAFVAEKDADTRKNLLNKLKICIDGLDNAQQNYAILHPESAGYVSAFKEVALDEVEGKRIDHEKRENVLVPWYDLHKILAGLLAVYTHLKTAAPLIGDKALKIARNFGEYVYRRLIQLKDNQKMLKTEYGGMNDALYELFEITKNSHFLIAAGYFDEITLFESLADGQDILAGKHANTTIPKIIGALHRYIIFLKSDQSSDPSVKQLSKNIDVYYKAAVNFWNMVVTSHTYVIGDNSQSEHFGQPDELYHDAEELDGAETCETCNAYNMLKLTRELFKVTGEKKYLDFYEKTYINTILASQNPETGMMTYFQPLAAGYTKIYNKPFDEFWCCTGTGIENFTKLSDSFYFLEKNRVYLNLYFANQLELTDANLLLDVKSNKVRSNFNISVSKIDGTKSSETKELWLRKPQWVGKNTAVKFNGETIKEAVGSDFYKIENISDGDQLTVNFSMNLQILCAPDNQQYVALQYGPYVLAGYQSETDNQVNKDHPGGVLVRMALRDDTFPSTFTSKNGWEKWTHDVKAQVVLETDSKHLFEVKIPNIIEDYKFIPYYQVYKYRYGVYFQWQLAGSSEFIERRAKQKKAKILQNRTIADLINFDNNNGEYTYHLNQKNSEVGDYWGHRYRIAYKDGFFSYTFDLHGRTAKKMQLLLLLNQNDADMAMKLEVSCCKHNTEVLKVNGNSDADENGFYTETINLDMCERESDKLMVSFASVGGNSPRIFGVKLMVV